MENILKKPYEISLWDDDLVFKTFAAQEVVFSDALKYEKDKYYYLNNFQDPDSGSGATNQFVIDGAKEPTEGRQYYTYGELLDEQIGSMKNKDYGMQVLIVQYYKERKICIIGSNTMDAPIRATSGKLVSNVNGSNTLTFNMYSKYYDEEAGEFYDNPFLKLLVNERKVKLRYGTLGSADCKWYDFIIKDVKENSETKTFSYTCKDLFINELSKSGFNIQLDPELENNMGNITTLAEHILDESDWRLGKGNTVISQTKEEPLYAIKLNQTIVAKDMEGKKPDVVIPPQNQKKEDNIIYAFYNIIANKEPYFQFVYCEDGKYEIDDDHVITNSPNYFIENVEYSEEGLPDFAKSMDISSVYRGDKLIRQAITFFDSTIDRYVNVFKKGQTEYYGFTKSEYVTPTAVQTFITNGEGFTSDSGWEVGGDYDQDNQTVDYLKLDLIGFPDPRDINASDWADVDNYRSFLRVKRTRGDQVLFNSGFADHRSAIKTLAVGEEFVIRAKISQAKSLNTDNHPSEMMDYDKIIGNDNPKIQVKIAEYTLNHGVYTLKDVYFEGAFEEKDLDDGWFYALDSEDEDAPSKTIKCKVARSYNDLINARIGIFIIPPRVQDNNANKPKADVYFENIQFFRYIEYDKPIRNDQNEITGYEVTMAEPGGELFSTARTKYIYYLPSTSYKSEDDMIPEYDSYVDNPAFVKQYAENQFEKIRSITASESNRFNLIQDLCETFECWAKFEIEHNPQTGEILLDDEYRQKKWVTFHEYIGKDNYVGFRYGVNLKSIQRTLNSDGIVSKIMVKNNANEFAPNGFCSISRATENPTGENFIINFDYYIQQGLIGFSEVNKDLYSDVNGYIGYYKKLKRLNQDREARIDLQSKLKIDISQYEANYQTYKLSVESAQEELRSTEVEIERLTGSTLAQLKDTPKNHWWNDTNLITKVNKIAQLNSLIRKHTELRDKEQILNDSGLPIGGRLYEAEQQFAALEDYIKNLAEQKRALNLRFYKKYSRFIQEGSWISEDYVDENLYYLDAESTLFTSAQPKVTYTINVLELSQLEGYENYSFALGDKTYIEDTEFFGWVWKNGIRTPYHEEIVVSEFTVELDSPEKNTFKVQNFKTQFEDLFQRIAATTQSVEYHTGEYGRASSAIQPDGTIAIDTLQNSMANNSIRLENAKDQTVVWDETGITTTSLSNPSEIVRIVSGGIFLSTDGGVTWNTGITGSGMNANFITTGQINTSVVNIMNGSFPSFRWDSKGLSAFEFKLDANGKPYGFNTAKFVRYDQYGVYGIDGVTGFEPSDENDIWNNAKFALTWKGFMLKNKYGEGYVSIDSQDDFIVSDGTKTRIQIGNISTSEDRNSNPTYGIRIANARGLPVMETDDSGELWLKNRMRVGTEETSTVEIGYLNAVHADTGAHEVIHAGDGGQKFIVYEDGKMFAQGVEIHGDIYAEGGQIGGLTVDQWEERGYEIVITSNIGNSMKQGSRVELTAKLFKGREEITQGLAYQWYNNEGDISGETNPTYVIEDIDFNENGYIQYGCKITAGLKEGT